MARFLNHVALARKPSAIREMTKLLQESPPTLISLAGGLPNPDVFPFKGITISLKDGHSWTFEGKALNTALQYSATEGALEMIAERAKYRILAERHPFEPLAFGTTGVFGPSTLKIIEEMAED
ncbi:unnamed protein product [Cyprideis torosa]|uniref:Uncharacterized protein n=1 Tax=Cyprideis torosa TaxID=163714 RepID=A0A7R8ZUX8_9CRUS|nr:unnamed protein product [Cyprideis torosa]CAG0909559.1 unnamed protein product [Cyprideis torosa]